MKSQIELAKEKGIEVGDRVKVVKRHNHWGSATQCGMDWVEEMNEYIGKTFRVIYVNYLGVHINEHYFPVQSLEKVEERKPVERVMLCPECGNHEVPYVSPGFSPEVPSWDADRVHVSVHMTKREYFAAMAMQGCIMNTGNVDAAWCVRAADALIAELNKWEG